MSVVQDSEHLRALYGEPTALGAKKDQDHIDPHARAFIARSPFVVVSTSGAQGWPEASPRGDAPGFVEVAHETLLLLPDRPGNNRLHSLLNVIGDGKIGLMFLVPRVSHSLRVYGRGRIRVDEPIRQRFAVRGAPARSVIEIAVELAYFHCGKAMIRSGLWDPSRWPETDDLASFGKVLSDQIAGVTEADADARILTSYRDRLY